MGFCCFLKATRFTEFVWQRDYLHLPNLWAEPTFVGPLTCVHLQVPPQCHKSRAHIWKVFYLWGNEKQIGRVLYLPGKHQVCVGNSEECQGISIYSTSSKPQLIFHMILLLTKHGLRHCSGQSKVAVCFTSSRATASKFGLNCKSNQDRLARTISKFSFDLFFWIKVQRDNFKCILCH